ncbi:dipeptide epimerase [Lutibacter sp. B2]|nr:dipeptide epimerase [Lutibacter sp. B2]
MKIVDIKLGRIAVPLKKPFKTALRTVYDVKDVIVNIITDTGNVGYGEAPPTGVITGDTAGSIIGAIEDHIKNNLIGMDIENFEEMMQRLNKSVIKNNSAKAAIDMALYDLYGQLYKSPVYKLLGGYRKEITTDLTISVNDPEEMAKDSIEAVKLGYKTLKIKVGKDAAMDIKRMSAIRHVIGYDVALRIDANQGWTPKEAVVTLRKMEDSGINIEFVEQPVVAYDLDGLKFVTDNVSMPVLADESMCSPMDAMKIIQMRAADLINIKLMKTGGIHNALKICAIAETYGMECMIGCMLEAKISVTAAVHLAAAKSIITKIDLDGPVLCKEDPIDGGAIFEDYKITLTDDHGFGFKGINGVVWKN